MILVEESGQGRSEEGWYNVGQLCVGLVSLIWSGILGRIPIWLHRE